MNEYDVYKAVDQIHDPCVRGSGPRVGPIWQYSKNRKKKFLLPYVLKKTKFLPKY